MALQRAAAAVTTVRGAADATKKVARGGAKRIYGPTQFAVPVVIFVLGAVVGALLLTTSGHVSCQFANDFLPDVRFYALGIVAFFGGHLLGEFGAPQPTGRSKRADQFAHGARVSGLAILGVVGVFEAFGVAEASLTVGATQAQLEPITFYVRCAIYNDVAGFSHGLVTAAVVFLTFFLVGHWLWGARPPRKAAS